MEVVDLTISAMRHQRCVSSKVVSSRCLLSRRVLDLAIKVSPVKGGCYVRMSSEKVWR